jgi:methylmalonyl-CoA mutase
VSEFAKPDEGAVEVAAIDVEAARTEARARLEAWTAGRAAAPDLASLPAPGSGALAAALVAAAGAGATVDEIMAALGGGGGATVSPLPRHRLGEDFEALRDRADAHEAATGRRPAVFLANLGTPAAYTTRSMFARNFFGAAGIEAVASGDCVTPGDAVEAWRAAGTPIAVLCSSDAVYGERGADTVRALQAAGAARIYLAGEPGAARAGYEAAGIDSFIHVRCNLVEMLDRALDELGVARS